MGKYLKVIFIAVSLCASSSFAELVYSQPFYQDSIADRHMVDYGWTTLNETTNGVVEDAVFVSQKAVAVSRAAGAPDVGALNAIWPEGITPKLRGYPYMATAHADLGDYPTDSSGLYYTTITNVIAISELGKLNLHQRADNSDSIIRFAIQIGAQWYASAEEFGGNNSGWTLKEMDEFDFTEASKWVEITIDATSITLGSNPGSDLSGNIDAYGVFVNTGITPNPGDHARFDNFQIHKADADAFYVAGSATDWDDPAAWSDGFAARSGVFYFATNSVVLETPAATTTFPGVSLTLFAPQRLEVMASGADVITVSNLTLNAADLAAGVVDAGEAQIDGSIEVVSSSMFSGATDNSRDLRVLSQVSGGTTVELSAPGQTIFIDNTNNTFNGTWIVSGGTGEFSSEEALGLSNIEVGSNGTLRINSDWDGYGKGDSLTVADSPNAVVDLGTNSWSVSSLLIGTSNVPQFITYTASELNALAENPVFTGSGTLHVGAPPQPQLLVGWERWVGGFGASCPATIETNGITGVAVNGGFDALKWGGSNDGTFGSLLSPTASQDTTLNEEGMRVENATTISFDFSVANTSGDAVDLNAFHFDALTKTKPGGPNTWTLEVVSGDITVGAVTNAALPYIGATGNLADFDVDLTALADHTLDAGGTILFRLTFSGGVPATTGATRLDMDNVALTKVYAVGPPAPPVINHEMSGSDMIVTWSGSVFKLQHKQDLVNDEWVDYPNGDTSPVTVPTTHDTQVLRLIEK